MKIKVSIIMPSLNVVDYIDEAIQSVREQSLIEIEILCIDAGSTDGTIDIIKRHEKEDRRVKYYSCDVKSYGYQVNFGINRLKGEFFGIVETDDYVDSNMYETLYSLVKEYDLDFAKANYKAFITQENGERFFLNRKNFINDKFYNCVIRPRDFTEIAIGDWYNCQGIYSSEFIRKYDIKFSETPGAAFQDIGFLYYAIVSAEKVMYTKDYFYQYRVDRIDSSSNSGKGIKYSYYEFKRLVEAAGEEWSFEQLRVLYLRMAKSFISSYGDLRNTEIKISDDERNSYYNWFKTVMKRAISKTIIQESDMPRGMWESLKALLESERQLQILQLKTDLIDEIKKRTKNAAEIIIFGCGNYGYDAYRELKRGHIDVKAFIDNNSELWGRYLEGIPIMAPANVADYNAETIFIIANDLYYKEMMDQLLNLGRKKEKICIYKKIME